MYCDLPKKLNPGIIVHFQMKQVRDYTILEKIGKGGFAKVYAATKGNAAEIFALKKIEKKDVETEKYIQGELDIARQKLKHRNIIQIFEYFKEGNIYIIMEYCAMGDLNAYLVQEKRDLGQRINFMTHMALGVNYLHTQNIIHRDLKPENVLITQNVGEIICKITDFGLSRIKQNKDDICNSYLGSFPYMAPEITGDSEYGSKIDIYALGMLYYAVYKNTILTNSFGSKSLIPGLYVPQNRIAYLNEVMKKEKPSMEQFLQTYFSKSNLTVGSFVYSMIDIKPENRPETDYILMQIAEIKAQHEHCTAKERQEQSIIKDLQSENDELRNEIRRIKAESPRTVWETGTCEEENKDVYRKTEEPSTDHTEHCLPVQQVSCKATFTRTRDNRMR